MKTKQEIQLELLQEVDEICSHNNLKYIFAGSTLLIVGLGMLMYEKVGNRHDK